MLTAVVGVLLGNLLIATLFAPALQKLREILAQFAEIELPYESSWPGAERMTDAQRRRAEQAAARDFNRLFREYTMSFGAFKRVGLVFVAAITVLACVVAWQITASTLMRLALMALFVSVVCSTGLFLQRAIAPTPSQLISIDFLQNNFANLHLSSLFNCSDIHINFGRMLGSRDPLAHFGIFQNLMFLGYRFLMAVSDERCSRVYFVSYGSLNSDITFQHMWTPEIQTFNTPLGDFSLMEAIRVDKVLQLNFWLFIPTPRGWAREKNLHPRILTDPITERMGDETAIRFQSSTCTWDSLDANVDFERTFSAGLSRWKLTRLAVPTANSPQAILKAYQRKIERCRRIQSYDYPKGIEIKDTG